MCQRGMGAVGAIIAMVIAGLIVYGIIYYGPDIWRRIQEGTSGGGSVPEVDMVELMLNYESDYIPVYLTNNYMGQEVKLTNLAGYISGWTVGGYHVISFGYSENTELYHRLQLYLYGEELENRNVLGISTIIGVVTALDIEYYNWFTEETDIIENCVAIHVLEAQAITLP